MNKTSIGLEEIKERVKLVTIPVQVHDKGNYIEVLLNPHNFSVKETLLSMKNIVNLIRCPFKLSVIHGFNHGQAIMNAVRKDFRSPRECHMYKTYGNPGITHWWISGDEYFFAYSVQ